MRAMIEKHKGMVPTIASVSVVSLALIVSVIWFLGTPGQVHACKCAEPGFSFRRAGEVCSSLRRESRLD